MTGVMTDNQRRAADLLARHPNLHIRDYVHRKDGARYELWDGDTFIAWYTSPPDAEAGICRHLGQPVPDHVRRAQVLWELAQREQRR